MLTFHRSEEKVSMGNLDNLLKVTYIIESVSMLRELVQQVKCDMGIYIWTRESPSPRCV